MRISPPHRFRRHKTPPFLRRRLWQFIGAIVVISVSSLLIQWLVRGRVPIWGFVTASALPGVLCGGLGGAYGCWMRRHFRRAHAAGGRICWDCGYALEGLADEDRCPECGRAFTLDTLRERWLVPGDHA